METSKLLKNLTILTSERNNIRNELKRKHSEYDLIKKELKTRLQYPTVDKIASNRVILGSFPVDKKKFIQTFKNSMLRDLYPNLLIKYLCSFPIREIRGTDHCYMMGNNGFYKYRAGLKTLPEVSILIPDAVIIEECWDLLRIKRVQRQVRRWLELPKYPSGNAGFFARKSWEACKLLTKTSP